MIRFLKKQQYRFKIIKEKQPTKLLEFNMIKM